MEGYLSLQASQFILASRFWMEGLKQKLPEEIGNHSQDFLATVKELPT